MTLSELKTAELFSRESANSLFARNAFLMGALSSVVIALPSIPVYKGNYYEHTNVTSGTSQTISFRYGPIQKESLKPKTELGKKLMELRGKAIAKGMTLLDQDNILLEVQKRRGLVE